MTDTRPQLIATNSGTTIHINTCWTGRQAHDRANIEPTTAAALAIDIAVNDLHPCKKCKPVSRLTWWERSHR